MALSPCIALAPQRLSFYSALLWFLLGWSCFRLREERFKFRGFRFLQNLSTFLRVQRLKLQPQSLKKSLHIFAQIRRSQNPSQFAVRFQFYGVDVPCQLQGSFFSSCLSLNLNHNQSSVLVLAVHIHEAWLHFLLVTDGFETVLQQRRLQ